MLTFCALLFFGLSGLRAQSNTEYNFNQQSLVDGLTYGSDGFTQVSTDPVPILTMDCIAANGYGQWTLTSSWGGNASSGDYTPGWYLLENALREPASSFVLNDPTHPGCQPPGVVEHGMHTTLNYIAQGNGCGGGTYIAYAPVAPKAAANLDGWNCFVWVDLNNNTPHQRFDIEYFRPADPADIDISLSGFPGNLLDYQGGTHVVKHDIEQDTFSTTFPPPIRHDVVAENDPRDDFDIAMDAEYLYITWCTLNGNKEIWVTAIHLSNFTTATGFPMRIDNGQYPTIACDVRNNRTPGQPAFDVCYLTVAGGNVKARTYNGGFLNLLLNPQCWDPIQPRTLDPLAAYHARIVVSSAANSPTPVRSIYVIAQVTPQNGTATAQRHLILYSELNSSAAKNAIYVDGSYIPATPANVLLAGATLSVIDEPITAFANPYNFWDENSNNNNSYDQFHCVYRLEADYASPTRTTYPLMIVEGYDNAAPQPFADPTTDTRLNLNVNGQQGLPAPANGSSYVAAVNQMGIHVHWRSGTVGAGTGTHFYARDAGPTTASDGHYSRAFDEPIEENTLVTDLCYVADSLTHVGTSGAMILPGKTLTIWSDPNYANNGFYQPPVPGQWDYGNPNPPAPPNPGTLSFVDPNVTLWVGDGITFGTPSTNSTLAVMPNFQLIFQGYPDGELTYSSQSVTVQAGATFNYYGLGYHYPNGPPINPLTNPPTFVPEITCAPIVGSEDLAIDGAGTITLKGTEASPAILNIEPGADMDILEDEFLKSGDQTNPLTSPMEAQINLLFGITILPTQFIPPGEPGNVSGVLTIEGEGILNNTTVTSQFPSTVVSSQANPWGYAFLNYPLYVPCPQSTDGQGNPNGSDELNDPPFQLTATNSTFQNTGGGTGIIRFDGNKEVNSATAPPFILAYNGVLFSGCTFTNCAISAWDPQPNVGNSNKIPIVLTNDFSIQGCTFTGLRQVNTIDIRRIALNTYGTINIGGVAANTFDPIALTANTASGTTDIFISGFNTMGQDGTGMSQVTVGNNTLENGNSTVGIDFEQSVGNVEGNSVSGNFSIAIEDNGPIPGLGLLDDHTFICSNFLTNSGVGIATSGYDGYLKLNTITGAMQGYNSGLNGKFPGMVANSITGSVNEGIVATGGLDMSGIFHSPNPNNEPNYAGFNVVTGNFTSSRSTPPPAQITLTSNPTQVGFDDFLGLSENPLGTNNNSSDLADAGQNSLVGGGGGTNILIEGDGETGRDVSNNWWGATGAPASSVIPNFNFASSSTFTLTGPPTIPFFECGSLNDVTHRKGNVKPQSETNDTASCLTSLGNGNSLLQDGYYDQAYDTMENYIRQCYQQTGAGVFGIYGDATTDTCLTPQGRAATKAFLLSVLPLRTDDQWFCACVGCLANSFRLDTNYDREIMSLAKWIADNPRCSYESSQVLAGYYKERHYDSSNWADTMHYPEVYDSSLLTMQQMGLDSVLIIAATEGVQYQPGASQIILDAHITANPFTEATNLSLLIGREAYIHIGVYNLLGEQIAGAGYNGTFEQGSAIVPMNLDASPQGIYYVRIQTANNETETLKLVKE